MPLTSTSITIAASVSSVTGSGAVTFTATISPGSGPTGTVVFAVDGWFNSSPVALSGGVATWATAGDAVPLTTGTHSVVAVYSGDSTYAGSTSSAVNVSVLAMPISTDVAGPCACCCLCPCGTSNNLNVTIVGTTTPSSCTGTNGVVWTNTAGADGTYSLASNPAQPCYWTGSFPVVLGTFSIGASYNTIGTLNIVVGYAKTGFIIEISAVSSAGNVIGPSGLIIGAGSTPEGTCPNISGTAAKLACVPFDPIYGTLGTCIDSSGPLALSGIAYQGSTTNCTFAISCAS